MTLLDNARRMADSDRAPEPVRKDRLLVMPREAAKMLSISERTLWSLTWPRGELRSVSIGRSRRYSVQTLEEFIRRKEACDGQCEQ